MKILNFVFQTILKRRKNKETEEEKEFEEVKQKQRLIQNSLMEESSEGNQIKQRRLDFLMKQVFIYYIYIFTSSINYIYCRLTCLLIS